MFELNDELVLDYLIDSREGLAAAEKELLAIESEGGTVNEGRITRICLPLHAVKGGSLSFDLVKVSELAQKTENAVARLRFQKSGPSHARISLLLKAIDRLNEMILRPDTSNDEDISDLLIELSLPDDGLQAWAGKDDAASLKQEPQPKERLRILLVEDDLSCRFLLQTFLARYGDCHVTVNGREAVEAFKAALADGNCYDLICMDIMMPEMDGREAVRQIRLCEEGEGIQSPFGATIFMTTTVKEIREVFGCFRELCDAYLLKPIDLGQLLSKMQFFELVR